MVGGGRKNRQQQAKQQMFSATADNEENLPRATRAVLKLLYWAFELLFWFLGVVVRVLAAGVVGAGKLVSKL